MNNQIIKDAISAAIAPNGVKAISGQVLQDALLDMIDALGAGATFLGSDPGHRPRHRTAIFLLCHNGRSLCLFRHCCR